MSGGTLNDLLSSDGEHVFLHFTTFNEQWEAQEERGRHLYSTSSLLDDKENQGSHWLFGYGDFQKMGVSFHWTANRNPGQTLNPVGKMLAFDRQSVWSIIKTKEYQYQLLQSPMLEPRGPNSPISDFTTTKEKRDVWNVTVEMRPRAMVQAGGHVFLLGAPEIGADLKNSNGIIHSFLTGNGDPALTLELPAVPIWDGVAVSQGRMFVSLEDGSLHCLGN